MYFVSLHPQILFAKKSKEDDGSFIPKQCPSPSVILLSLVSFILPTFVGTYFEVLTIDKKYKSNSVTNKRCF